MNPGRLFQEFAEKWNMERGIAAIHYCDDASKLSHRLVNFEHFRDDFLKIYACGNWNPFLS